MVIIYNYNLFTCLLINFSLIILIKSLLSQTLITLHMLKIVKVKVHEIVTVTNAIDLHKNVYTYI